MNELAKKLDAYWTKLGAAWEKKRTGIAAATGWKCFNPIKDDNDWHRLRLELYPPEEGGLLVVGLNPGLYGMLQTGMPLTDQCVIATRLPKLLNALLAARKWKGERGQAPEELLPFLNPSNNSENSSWPVYELLTNLYGTAEKGLERAFFLNPCPLAFVDPRVAKQHGRAPVEKDLKAALRQTNSKIADDEVADFIKKMNERRYQWTFKAAKILKPVGILLLGADNRALMENRLRKKLAAAGLKVVVTWYNHPRMPIPSWANGARARLRAEGFPEPQ
ncbi:hypothetical protein [Myxococcus sp. AS-1-15]|uniref:hypothetical protein n=1 Tax=Myxococcus sp. AS-1-15 TaxID=2874600 RepID=UPI001CBE2FFF|nr:hypothetical protein [Myxococcus sp. AS-1-15]MBZ4401596.1 hypothetical protein [Myxococcus sp. AS-1-15]BDT35540.1 hypothetical protein MFMH1_52090 [Myxococcus sp. MH1]